VSDFVRVPVALIGVGPARDQIIWTKAAGPLAEEPQHAPAESPA
jgi:hypothetical protein